MKTLKKTTIICLTTALASCAVIRPGEIGVKRTMGKLAQNTLEQGSHGYNPFITQIIKTNIKTQNLELAINLPSKEGLNVSSEISILFRIEKSKVPYLIENIGSDYLDIIRSVFRSSSADICSRFLAKDMHSGKRSEIENEIAVKMNQILEKQGIVVEAVLLKTIKLPEGLYSSIEDRLEAEQTALRMQFVLQQEELEAERKVIEAKGVRDAQLIMSEGLTNEIIKLKSIDAFVKLSESQSSKVIITNGSAPFLIDNQMPE